MLAAWSWTYPPSELWETCFCGLSATHSMVFCDIAWTDLDPSFFVHVEILKRHAFSWGHTLSKGSHWSFTRWLPNFSFNGPSFPISCFNYKFPVALPFSSTIPSVNAWTLLCFRLLSKNEVISPLQGHEKGGLILIITWAWMATSTRMFCI